MRNSWPIVSPSLNGSKAGYARLSRSGGPDHIPQIRAIDVETLADDPKYGDLPGVADALRRRPGRKGLISRGQRGSMAACGGDHGKRKATSYTLVHRSPLGPPVCDRGRGGDWAGPLCTPSWSPPVDAAPPRRRQTPRFRGRPYPIGTPFASAIRTTTSPCSPPVPG